VFDLHHPRFPIADNVTLFKVHGARIIIECSGASAVVPA
jgi:hypothetical protein